MSKGYNSLNSGESFSKVIISSIILRRNRSQFRFDFFAHGQSFDEFVDGLLVDVFVGPCEALQKLIGTFDFLAAQDRLDGFGHHGIVLLQVLTDLVLVEQEFIQTLHQRLDGDEGVGQRHADVAGDGGVGEVALQAADGELGA